MGVQAPAPSNLTKFGL
uniref:Uncharacterized protein n=1 Tax=Rhizophora mucronata TaxID=61149 RepID=A0A2P2NXT7_RHIMU